MSIRRIPKNYRNVTGIVASRKVRDSAAFESTLERDFYTLLEFTPTVQSYDVQPVEIRWHDGAKWRRYTPDVLVTFHTQEAQQPPWLCEVKYRSDLKKDWADLKPKLRAGIRYAREQGLRFRVMTEVEIRTPYLANAKFLLPFKRQPIELAHSSMLLDALQDLRETSPESLLMAVCRDEWHRAALVPTLWRLVATFRIAADLHAPLTMRSRIWSPS